MTKARAITIIERELAQRGTTGEVRDALQALRATKRAGKVYVPARNTDKVGVGLVSCRDNVADWQRREYLDTFGPRGSDERDAQDVREANLPMLPQFDHEWMPASKGKLLTLQAVGSMAQTAFVHPSPAARLVAA